MERFFAGWRAVVDWLIGALALACGVFCLIGAAQIVAVRGPVWMAALSAGFGAAVIVGVAIRAKRAR